MSLGSRSWAHYLSLSGLHKRSVGLCLTSLLNTGDDSGQILLHHGTDVQPLACENLTAQDLCSIGSTSNGGSSLRSKPIDLTVEDSPDPILLHRVTLINGPFLLQIYRGPTGGDLDDPLWGSVSLDPLRVMSTRTKGVGSG